MNRIRYCVDIDVLLFDNWSVFCVLMLESLWFSNWTQLFFVSEVFRFCAIVTEQIERSSFRIAFGDDDDDDDTVLQYPISLTYIFSHSFFHPGKLFIRTPECYCSLSISLFLSLLVARLTALFKVHNSKL